MSALVRAAARAFLLATVAALVADALLGTLTRLVDVVGAGHGTPWWVAAHVVERGRWVVLALLLVTASVRFPELPGAAPGEAAVWRGVGFAVAAVPLLWLAAGWMVQVALFTAAGRWAVDGQIFLAADYYRELLVGYAPWLLGGGAVIAVSRHTT